jgi:hypothetical protein
VLFFLYNQKKKGKGDCVFIFKYLKEIKSPQYLSLARIRDGLSERKIINMIFANGHKEYLNIFPEDKKMVEPYIIAYEKLIENISIEWEKYKKTVDKE